MSQVRFVKLPTGAVIDLENIAAVLTDDLKTKYVFIPKASASPNAPALDSKDFDVFWAKMEELGLAATVDRPKAANEPVIATK